MPLIKLTNGAAHLLRNALNVPEALTTLKEKFAAGVLLTTTLDVLPEQPKDDKAWIATPWQEVELTGAQYSSCRAALTRLADKLPVGAALNALVVAFELME